ncbi:MAG: phosphoglycerate kinase [Puniceicoccales bacterium]|nr:phosphoglycerate kinase [Puniceicoccales bacterium]
MGILTVKDVNLSGKRVLVRVDFNVPLGENGEISDDTRIIAAIPTIKYLADQGAKVILVSHLGRPNGEKNDKFSLAPVVAVLSKRLNKPVLFLNDCIGESVHKIVLDLQDGDVVLLENVRFYAEETKNDESFSKKLADLAEAFVNDAFGTAHRAHASTVGVTKFLSPCVAGFLMEKELKFLGEKTSNPERPFTVILGGAKVSDKISVIDSLLDKADAMIIGGAMAYTFMLAKGNSIGASLVELDKVDVAVSAIKKAQAKGVKLLLPLDSVVTDKIDFDARSVGELKVVDEDIPDGLRGVDIGPKTIDLYKKIITESKTVLMNGPLGIFEIETCANGTFEIAKAIASSKLTSIIGGGDSVKAVKKSGFADNVTFISTGGGASLEFLEGKELPGIVALDKK